MQSSCVVLGEGDCCDAGACVAVVGVIVVGYNYGDSVVVVADGVGVRGNVCCCCYVYRYRRC